MSIYSIGFLFLSIFLFIIPLPSVSAKCANNTQSRIYGGKEIDIDETPYQVFIKFVNRYKQSDQFMCGGAIIGERWVLTARHCLQPSNYKVTVQAGSNYISSLNEINVERIIGHPKNVQKTSVHNDYDFALLKLAQPIHFTRRTKPIALPQSNDQIDVATSCYVSGWGETERHSTSQTLRGVRVKIVDSKKCEQLLHTRNLNVKITPRMICAGRRATKKNTCRGDSGGALVCNNKLIGIVSFGLNECAQIGIPSVYGRVSTVRSWIKSNTGI